MWADLSAADVVRRIYNHLAVDGWSCKRIANEFNDLGIPTAYRRAGRGVRGKRTRETWHSGHVRNLVVNPVYRGELQYGRRSSRPNGRSVISASVPPLVSDDVWNAAIATLKRNRIAANNSRHAYLLRSLIRCAVCGLAFCGTWARTAPRYRCNGAMVERGPFPGKCIGASIKGELLEDTVWSDVSRFLSEPEDLIDELLADSNDAQTRAVAEAERVTLTAARDAAQDRRFRALDIYTRGKIPESDFDAITAEVDRELNRLDERLAALEPPKDDPSDAVASEDLLSEIRNRLDGGLTQAQRQEIVQLLVRRITVHTTLPKQGRKQVRIVIDYRFPGAAKTGTGTLRVPATISPALSPPEPESARRTTVSSSHSRRRSLPVPVSPASSLRRRHPEGPGNAPISRSHASSAIARSAGWASYWVTGCRATCRRSQRLGGAFVFVHYFLYLLLNHDSYAQTYA